MGSPPVLRVDAWRRIPALVHGFFGRRGGVSGGDWDSLNLSEQVGDDPGSVSANWEMMAGAVPCLTVVRARQVHGARIVAVQDSAQSVGPADGMMTASTGLGLALLTADCVPVLMVAPAARVVMAVHAGWRGTLAGITPAAIAAAQRELGVQPSQWQVALGPAIGGCCYEVDANVGVQLAARWGEMPDAWKPGTDRGKLDLRRANRRQAAAAGIPLAQIAEVGPCTACASDEYFSHRRSGGRTGRQLSIIGWDSEMKPASR